MEGAKYRSNLKCDWCLVRLLQYYTIKLLVLGNRCLGGVIEGSINKQHWKRLNVLPDGVDIAFHLFCICVTNSAILLYQGCTPRPAPAPGEMAAPGRPGPENFQLCPAPPRPTPKITPGQESGQMFLHHQKFLGVKNF